MGKLINLAPYRNKKKVESDLSDWDKQAEGAQAAADMEAMFREAIKKNKERDRKLKEQRAKDNLSTISSYKLK